MSVDPGMVDAILGTFRGMSRQIAEQGLKGESVDRMNAALATMERLAVEMDDLAAYSAKLATDGLFTDFSNWYGRALGEAQQASSGGQDQSDEALLAQSLKAYEQSLSQLKAEPAHAHIVPVVQKVVDIGRSGVSYPEFLRICEEEGAFLGLNSPHARPTIEYDIYCYGLLHLPVQVEMYTKILKRYDELVAAASFGYPDPVQYEIESGKIEWEYAPRIALWKAITERWERMIGMVHDWVDSFTSFAPGDGRWAAPGGTPAMTRKNIERTQECEPGRLAVREAVFKEYFGLSWYDIWEHPTYKTQYNARQIWYSNDCLDYIKNGYPLCKPGGRPGPDLIAKAEALHASGGFRRPNILSAEEMKPMAFPQFLKEKGYV